MKIRMVLWMEDTEYTGPLTRMVLWMEDAEYMGPLIRMVLFPERQRSG